MGTVWIISRIKTELQKKKQSLAELEVSVHFFLIVLSSILPSRKVIWIQLLCQTHLFCQGRLYEYKAPLDAQVLLIYSFLLNKLIYILILNLKREEGEQRKRKGNETWYEKTMRKTRQHQKTTCYIRRRTKQTMSYGLLETRWRVPAWRKMEKKNTNSNNTSNKYTEDNCGYWWFETTGCHSNCKISQVSFLLLTTIIAQVEVLNVGFAFWVILGRRSE